MVSALAIDKSSFVEEVLRSRKICRPIQGQPLFGIYRTVCTEVQQQLFVVIAREVNRTNPPQLPAKAWAQEQLNLICKKRLDEDCLTAFALTAQDYPPQSKQRQYALNELIRAVLLSGQLRCTRKTQNPGIWDEAINETLTYIYQKIDKFNPKQGKFITWINFRLDRKVVEAWKRREILPDRPMIPLDEREDIQTLSNPGQELSVTALIHRCLEEDVDGHFAQEHIRGYPQVDFRTIALCRFSGTNWEIISSQFQIKIPTLSSFFRRSCKKFRPVFRQYIQDALHEDA